MFKVHSYRDSFYYDYTIIEDVWACLSHDSLWQLCYIVFKI